MGEVAVLVVLMTDVELVEWLDLFEAAAVRAATTGDRQAVNHPTNPIAVIPMIGPARGPTSFTGPVVTSGDPWRLANKLTKKATQTVEAGGGWIRVDVLDGLWQFTDWARWALPQKAEAILPRFAKPSVGSTGCSARLSAAGQPWVRATSRTRTWSCPEVDWPSVEFSPHFGFGRQSSCRPRLEPKPGSLNGQKCTTLSRPGLAGRSHRWGFSHPPTCSDHRIRTGRSCSTTPVLAVRSRAQPPTGR